jgi:hypothetical protein
MLTVLNQIGLAMSSLFLVFLGGSGEKYGDSPKRCRLKRIQRGSQRQKGQLLLFTELLFFPQAKAFCLNG